MSERGLHFGQGRTTIESVGAVGMPQPVRGDGTRDARPFGGSLQHVIDGALAETAARSLSNPVRPSPPRPLASNPRSAFPLLPGDLQ